MARTGVAPARRRVVVTGGSGGIGRALLAAFAGEGHEVVAMARDDEALRAAVATVAASSGGQVAAVPCDVADEEAVAAAFATLSRVDVLVAGAGVAEAAPLARTTLAAWRHHLDANATGTFLCARAVLPGMAEAGWGRIVAVASTAARVGGRYTAAYTASKHAALGLVRAVAAEVAGTGVTANAVCPAFVDTPMTDASVARIREATGRSEAEARSALAAQAPLGRLVTPEEVAAAVSYLASPAAAPVNGQALVLDGGGIQG